MPIGHTVGKPSASPRFLRGCSEKLTCGVIHQTSCRYHCWICIGGLLTNLLCFGPYTMFIFTLQSEVLTDNNNFHINLLRWSLLMEPSLMGVQVSFHVMDLLESHLLYFARYVGFVSNNSYYLLIWFTITYYLNLFSKCRGAPIGLNGD